MKAVPFTEVNLRLESGRAGFEEPRCFVFGSEEAVKRVYGGGTLKPTLDFGRSLREGTRTGLGRGYSLL